MTGKLCSAACNNSIFFVAGGWCDLEGRLGASDEILGLLDEEQVWEEFGKMKEARSNHAVTTIQMDDQAMDHCG